MITQTHRSQTGEAASPSARISFTPALIGSAVVAALGGLLFGFDTAVISGTTDALRSTYLLDDASLGFTVAIALIGTILESIFAGKPADVLGRKRTLMVLAVLYFVSALGSALAWDWYSFLAFRFLGGLAVGGASVVSPMYIAEISPAPCAVDWSRHSNSTLSWASCSRFFRTISSRGCTSAPRNGDGCWGSRWSRRLPSSSCSFPLPRAHAG